jgi:mRNA-degrading endonuclease RelE of RelBE toxin-antitoxin system
VDFRIADTFTDSLVRLTGDEQKAVKTTAFDLQVNLAGRGLSFHKLDKARDKNFWSVRVSSDIRLIVHKTEGSLLLCYVGPGRLEGAEAHHARWPVHRPGVRAGQRQAPAVRLRRRGRSAADDPLYRHNWR